MFIFLDVFQPALAQYDTVIKANTNSLPPPVR